VTQTQVLDHGELELLELLGEEQTICRAARVSTGKDRMLNPSEKVANDGLIRYLLTNRHGTPFEHVVFQFRVKAPIFVTREWMRHRIGSFNERSGRYSKYEPKFYTPRAFRTQTGKPGAYVYEDLNGEPADHAQGLFNRVHHVALESYQVLLELGVANELACRVLPTTLYTEFYWTVNARALMNFLSLRTAETAQWEIRQYANVIDGLFTSHLPATAAAFNAAGRVAP
jgi:thymidylate synthase (FAD)